MEDFVKIITHVRRFKSAVKGLSVAQLEGVKGKLEGIIRDREKELTWSGQGRMPNVFREQIKAGKSIDDYLIG